MFLKIKIPSVEHYFGIFSGIFRYSRKTSFGIFPVFSGIPARRLSVFLSLAGLGTEYYCAILRHWNTRSIQYASAAVSSSALFILLIRLTPVFVKVVRVLGW